MSGPAQRTGLIPARLSFLAIYNPSLSRSEETLHEQIVYYYSASHRHHGSQAQRRAEEAEHNAEEKNERLRQVGLAQGMVEFAKNFSDGVAVDSVETEKSRIVLHELEPGWWILASIELTRLLSSSDDGSGKTNIEYSAREVSPPALLLQQLLRAYKVFLLHHATSLADLYVRTARSKFCNVLRRFWNGFAAGWDVLLHENPAVAIFNGLKLAAGGELGVGVGEEEWGSGEREVLEDFIARTEGLVDLLVSRFGDAPAFEQKRIAMSSASRSKNADGIAHQGMTKPTPRPADGVVFSGVGNISRQSVKTISHWAESIYAHGQDAYGVRDNPVATRRRKLRKGSWAGDSARQGIDNVSELGIDTATAIPPSIVDRKRYPAQPWNGKQSLKEATVDEQRSRLSQEGLEGDESGAETMMKYLTLGVYGSKWGIPFKRTLVSRQTSNLREESQAGSSTKRSRSSDTSRSEANENLPGRFIVGYRGGLEAEYEDEGPATDAGTETEGQEDSESQGNRIMVRVLHVDRLRSQTLTTATSDRPSDSDKGLTTESYPDRLRVVVYERQPFMFVFLFELHSDSLTMPALYRSIHHQLGPLQRPLLNSTSPERVSDRLSEAALPRSTASIKSAQPISDLVYDPLRLTVHSSIPNIPEPGTAGAEGLKDVEAKWSRVEALNVHTQILNTYSSTRRAKAELERTCKTGRGWWVVWMRLPQSSDPKNASLYREAFLIRKASDYTPPAARKASSRFGRDVRRSNPGAGWGPGKLAEGIGIDARQYIDGLLSLNR